MHPVRLRAFLTLASALLAPIALAEIRFYDVLKNSHYFQTSTSQPTVATWDFVARINSNVDNEVTAGTVTFDGGTRNLAPFSSREVGYIEFNYATEAALDAAYPTGDYSFASIGGTSSGQSGSLTVPNAVRPNEVPYLTGSGFDDLTNAVAGESVTVTWDPFTVPSPVDFEFVFFILRDLTAGTVPINVRGVNGTYTSQAIDGSLLIDGHDYLWSIYFDPRFEIAGAGFNGTAASVVGFDAVTDGRFTVEVVPEPASLAALAIGTLALTRRRKS